MKKILCICLLMSFLNVQTHAAAKEDRSWWPSARSVCSALMTGAIFGAVFLTSVSAESSEKDWGVMTYSARKEFVESLRDTCAHDLGKHLRQVRETSTPKNPLGNLPPEVEATYHQIVDGNAVHVEINEQGTRTTLVFEADATKGKKFIFDQNGYPQSITNISREKAASFMERIPNRGAVSARIKNCYTVFDVDQEKS